MLLIDCLTLVRVDERQKLLDELARYLTFRKLMTDKQARDAIDERIREIENRLAEIDQSSENSNPK
jgi:flagellar motility protein MotE (MotC chaperone)